MQRAAASSPAQASTPGSWTSHSPSEPPTKRQRLSSSHSTSATPLSDQQAIQAALDAEEAKRSKALARVAAERGETKWALSYVDEEERRRRAGFKVAQAGYGEIDADEGLGSNGKGRWGMIGRRSFGNFNKDLEVCEMQYTLLRIPGSRHIMTLLNGFGRRNYATNTFLTSRSNRMVSQLIHPPCPAMRHPKQKILRTVKKAMMPVVQSI